MNSDSEEDERNADMEEDYGASSSSEEEEAERMRELEEDYRTMMMDEGFPMMPAESSDEERDYPEVPHLANASDSDSQGGDFWGFSTYEQQRMLLCSRLLRCC